MFSHGSFSQTINYQYNALDQNTVAQDGAYTYRFDYDERGNVRTLTTGNGAGSTFTYDDCGLVESVSVGTADGKEILSMKTATGRKWNPQQGKQPSTVTMP
jgi:uncharacterized protein RhaS with RHS repeats